VQRDYCRNILKNDVTHSGVCAVAVSGWAAARVLTRRGWRRGHLKRDHVDGMPLRQGGPRAADRELSPRELAVEFRRAMQSHPELIGRRLSSDWIKQRYPLLCASLGVTYRPPFPAFAKELALVMPKRRQEARRNGKRIGTYTTYLVPDPAAGVVALSEEKRRRA